MVVEFCGFTKGVIGKDLPADSTLENMKKADLIKLLHTAQHNYETLMWFYNNAVAVNVNANNQKVISELENLKKCYNGDEDAVMYPMSFEAYIQKIIDLAKENCTSTDYNKPQNEVLSKDPSDIRLIDANALKSCYTGSNGMDNKTSYKSIRKMIDLQPEYISKIETIIKNIKSLKEIALKEYNIGEYNLDNGIGNKIAEDRKLYGEYGTDEASFLKKQDKLIRMLQEAHLTIQSEYVQSGYIKNARKSRRTGISDLFCKKLDDRREVIERALSQVESGQPLTEDIIIWQAFEPWSYIMRK